MKNTRMRFKKGGGRSPQPSFCAVKTPVCIRTTVFRTKPLPFESLEVPSHLSIGDPDTRDSSRLVSQSPPLYPPLPHHSFLFMQKCLFRGTSCNKTSLILAATDTLFVWPLAHQAPAFLRTRWCLSPCLSRLMCQLTSSRASIRQISLLWLSAYVPTW
ncbi:hypothetical protein LZ32DRAFT_38595 [Colletotrichum eremochloae]|nr:hypothetical protein LZ32DRAFT_38595 [Colletotrichum eremochloae]